MSIMKRLIDVVALSLALLTCEIAGKENVNTGPASDGYRHTKYTDAQNELMKIYIGEFENFQKTQSEDYQKAMETSKLLIIQSWIYVLSPNKNLLESFITLEEKSSLEEIWLSLGETIKTKTEAFVADDFLLYNNSIATRLTGVFEERVENFGIKAENVAALIANEKDDLKKEELNRQRVEYIDQKDQAELLIDTHHAAVKMAVQSYILDFVSYPKGLKTYAIEPSDSSKTRVVEVPNLVKGYYEGFFIGNLDEGENEINSK